MIKAKIDGMDSDKVSSDTYRNYCSYEAGYQKCPFYEAYNKQTNSSGCYLTTACMRSQGLLDDCVELTTMRVFRDTWLSLQPGGKEDIQEYYRFAPEIVQAINAREDAQEVYQTIYEQVVAPCVELIRAQSNKAAWALYKASAISLYKQTLCWKEGDRWA